MNKINEILIYLTHPYIKIWNFSPDHEEKLRGQFPEIKLKICRNSKYFLNSLPYAEAVIIWFFKKDWYELAPKLQLIATPAAGADWIEPPEKSKHPAIWHGGFHGSMIAESVVGAVFYFCKAFDFSQEIQRKKLWAREELSHKLNSLYGAKVTILGFGRIGQHIGRVLKQFNCQITGVKRTPCPAPGYFGSGDEIIFHDQLEEALKKTDHMIMALPGGSETDGIFRCDHFKLLPETCFIYNIGRGNLYKEEDLVDALQKGEIAGAYLDVFETEPLPETSQLWEMRNVLIQPHLSAASPQYLDLFIEEFIARLKEEMI